MAVSTQENWLSRLLAKAASKPSKATPSKKLYGFAAQAFKKTNGATPELKSVYKAYLDNQRKKPSA